MPEHDELDGRIRELLGRAVADAPPPPDLEGLTVTPNTEQRNRNRWLLGGATGLSIAAALIALVLYEGPDDLAEPVVPATRPSTTMPTATESTPVPTATPTSTPSATASTEPTTASTPPSTPPSTTASTEPEPTEPTSSPVAVAAGPNGVSVTGADGIESIVTNEPMSVAFAGRDGRVYMQRSDDVRDAAADTTILVSDPATGGVDPLPLPEELVGPTRLHGATDIDGTVLLLETGPGNCNGFENCDGALWAYRVDAGAASELDRMNVWEAGWSRLHLADSGMAVGTFSEGPTASLYSISLTGDAAIAPATVGLEDSYGDCTNCPSAFSIDRTGKYLTWLEWNLDTFQHTVVVTAVDGSTSASTLLTDPDGSICCLDGPGPSLPVEESLEIAGLVPDGDGFRGQIFVNETSVLDRRQPVVVDLPSGTVTVRPADVTTTFGTLATSGGG
jgi:hypothetical protein